MKPIPLNTLTVAPKLATKLLFEHKWARTEQTKQLMSICQAGTPYQVKNKNNLVWFLTDTHAVLVNRSAKFFSDLKPAQDLNTDILDGFTPIVAVTEKSTSQPPQNPTTQNESSQPTQNDPIPQTESPSIFQEIITQAEATYQADLDRAKRRFEYNITKDLIFINMDEIDNFHKLAHDIAKGRNTVHNHAKIQPLIESLKVIRGVIKTIESKIEK